MASNANAVIAQSGGPTVVINRSLVAAVRTLRDSGKVNEIYGARFGIKGIINRDFFNLHDTVAFSDERLDAVAKTPGAALGTSRKKPSVAECEQIFDVFRGNNVRYFIYLGGNDSAETAYILYNYASDSHYDLFAVHGPKTIDNDLRENDHTPGHGSAAVYVALASMGINYDNLSMPGIIIQVIMGKNAGFLTAASTLGIREADDGPHLVYLPEREFIVKEFVDDVKAVYERLGRVQVAVSEGIWMATDGARKTMLEILNRTNGDDGFGLPTLSGTGALGDYLAGLVRKALPGVRVRADTFGYVQRSFPIPVSAVDASEAWRAGSLRPQ